MSDRVIRARNLGKCYQLYDRPTDRLRELLLLKRRIYHRPFWALRELDLEIERGECIGLIGANGAGKSTTLKILAGKVRPTTGTVEVEGRISSILELGTGFHPQLTGRQNARVNALFLGLRPWESERHIARILEFAEIGDYADQPLATYSSGMQARLAFSVLATFDPEVLILDEALATGDAQFAAKCNDHLRNLCSSGCTTVVASHDVVFLASACDRIIWIAEGRKVAEGAPREMVHRYLQTKTPDSFGNRLRPRYALLRIAAEDAMAQPTFTVHSFEWLDDRGTLLAEYYVGDEQAWLSILDAATYFGFTPQGARVGWDAPELTAGLNRKCRPHQSADGTAYLTLPLPQDGTPSRIRIAVKHDAPCHAVFTLQAGGRSRELGRIGRLGTVPADTPANYIEFPRFVFDVSDFFGTIDREASKPSRGAE